MRRLASALSAVVLLTVAAAPAYGQGDTTAVAVNTRDGADVFRLAFSIRRVMSETVDTSNAAVAVSSCTDCQTVAIAIQVALVFSDPDVVTPENLALAMNIECSLCDTLASAYQMVITTGGPVHLTEEGNRRIAEIRRKLLALRDSDLTGPELQAEVDGLYHELADVIATELVPAGPPAGTVTSSSTTTTTAETSSSSTSTSTPPSSSTTTTTTEATASTSTTTTTAAP
jgi:putative peptide zinc metalloprotease protein